jgi:hypothetical protein
MEGFRRFIDLPIRRVTPAPHCTDEMAKKWLPLRSPFFVVGWHRDQPCCPGSGVITLNFGEMPAHALRAEAMAELGIGMPAEIGFDLAPVALVVADLLAE